MSIYDHFRAEEAMFVDKALDWKTAAETYHKTKLTDFLDPREQQIAAAIIGSYSDAAIQFFGASPQAERKRALIYPPYLVPEEADFQIDVLEVEYASKFYTIEHRQVLGALMSLGVKREKFGDIFIGDEKVQIAVATEVTPYIQMNLQSIGRAKVSLSVVSPDAVIKTEETWTEKSGTVSSLRLDVLLAEMFRLPRQKSQILIKSGLVKVNWKIIEQPSFECYSGDVLSARGHGRGKILSIEGKSKRDKWRIVYGLLK
ncbi:MAG: RNA-binding protein [Ectobacillus sp.]